MADFATDVCNRCGSKKRISKTWRETLQTFSGTSILEMSQIVCTNEECQKLFEINRAEEIVKRNAMKLKKEETEKIRKAHMVQSIAKKREERLGKIPKK